MAIQQRITPFLWFDSQAEEAAKLYCSIFKNSEMGQIVRYGDVGPGPKGQVMIVTFKIEGQEFTALNEKLQNNLELWSITTLNVAAIAVGGIVRVKAVAGPDNSVEFEEPKEDFPSDQLMTQLRMIAPDKKARR